MTEGYCALAELCATEITDGTHQTPVYSDKGYIFLSSKNVTSGVIDWENVKYIPEDLHNELYARIKPQVDDILLAKNGTTGIAALVDRDEVFDIYVSLALIRPDKNKILPQYLLYAINSSKSQRFFNSNLKGIGVPNLHLTHIRETPIKIYPLSQQSKIVEKLRYIDNLLRKYTQKLSILDNLVKSRFIEMFGTYITDSSRHKKLKEVCNFIDYRGKTPEKSDSGIPLITAKNVRDNHFSVEPQEFIPIENYEAVMTRGIPKVNDVLFTTEAPLGNVCRIPGLYDKFCVGQRIVTMQPHADILIPEYLERTLLSDDFQEKIWQQATGSTVKGIRSKRLIELTIPVPPLDIQKKYADFVALTDKSKLAVQQSIDTLQTLKDKLMQDYFG